MTTFEMHLYLQQGLRQVGSNFSKKYLNEELDAYLNKAQEKFVQDRVKPKPDGSGAFEISEVDADAITPLIVSDKILTPYIEEGKNRYANYLPHDYAYLLENSCETLALCGGAVPIVEDRYISVETIPWMDSPKTTPPYYVTIYMSVGYYYDGNVAINMPPAGNIQHNLLPYGAVYNGYANKRDKIFIYKWMAFKRGWYMERFPLVKADNSFVIVNYDQDQTQQFIQIDGQDTQADKYAQFHIIPTKVHTNTGGELVPNRILPTNKIKFYNGVPFWHTNADSPIAELGDGVIYIYYDNSFIVGRTHISYVRKPQIISLSLGLNCELPETFHHKICDIAVEMMKTAQGDVQGTQLAVAQNERRVAL